MPKVPGAGGVVIDIPPIDFRARASTKDGTAPIDALAIFGDAISDISTARSDLASQKLRLLEEQNTLELEAAKQKILDDAKASKVVADNSAALFANDALVRLSQAANSNAMALAEWQNPKDAGTVASKLIESALLGFTEGFSGVKLKSHEQQLQEASSSATAQIGNINASINAIKSGAEATKRTVTEATLQQNLRLASNLINTKTLDDRDAVLATNAAAIKAVADGIKPAMDALTMWHNEGLAERQFKVMQEERAKDNSRADRQLQFAQEEFAFRKEDAIRDNARQDAAAERANKNLEIRNLNEAQDVVDRAEKKNKELKAEQFNEQVVAQYKRAIERVGARIDLHSDPSIALMELDLMRKSKNPQKQRVITALDTFVTGMQDQQVAGFAGMQHFDVYGDTAWDAMTNSTLFPFPGMHPEERGVIDFQKHQLDMMQIPQPKVVTTTGPKGEIKTIRSNVLEAPFDKAKTDAERAFVYNNEIDRKARELQANVEVGGKDNIYSPPTLASLESIGAVVKTRLFLDVIKPQIAAGQTTFEASDIIDKALAARDAGILSAKELVPTLSTLFKSVVLHNNIMRNFVGHGLPAQTTYNVMLEHPVSEKAIRYNLHDETSLGAYIAVKEYTRSRGLVRKYLYDATGMHKSWMPYTSTEQERKDAGMGE